MPPSRSDYRRLGFRFETLDGTSISDVATVQTSLWLDSITAMFSNRTYESASDNSRITDVLEFLTIVSPLGRLLGVR